MFGMPCPWMNGFGKKWQPGRRPWPVQPAVLLLESRCLPAGLIVTGADDGGGPEIKAFDPATQALKLDFFAYDPHFLGGVRVASGDVNDDGVSDVITAPGPSGGPDVRVFDGKTGQLIREFMAYDPNFRGGVFTAAGDVNGDGFADIVTGADAGGGPHVEVFSGKDGSVLDSFFAYDPHFLGGVRVAAGDVNHDGRDDVITGAGPGGGPHVRVFDGATGQQLAGAAGSFFAYDPGFKGGVFVAAGDLDGDGHDDVITGAGDGGGPHVRAVSGKDGHEIASFMAYGTRHETEQEQEADPLNDDNDAHVWDDGVHVAAADVNGDGRDDIVTGVRDDHAPIEKAFDDNGQEVESFFAYDEHFRGGFNVGGDG